MSRKVIGVTVGTTLPKPNFKQTDPTKGDYIKNRPDFDGLQTRVADVEGALEGKQPTGDYALKSEIPSTEGLATETYVNNKVAGLVDSAPETLDTLNELAAALGDDPNFATTLATQIGALQAALTINYDELTFDTSEIVIGNLTSTSSILGQAILGQLVLA